MREIRLRSPEIRGFLVSRAQTALQETGFYEGEITGTYDILTAQAVWRAKYWLGFTPDHVYTEDLRAVLLEERFPLRNRLRRWWRVKTYRRNEDYIWYLANVGRDITFPYEDEFLPFLWYRASLGEKLSITLNPRKGDLALLDLDGDGEPDKLGIFICWLEGRLTFTTIEKDGVLKKEERLVHQATFVRER
jgi:hypothetical protein